MTVLLDLFERDLFDRAAAATGENLSAWVRRVLRAAAHQALRSTVGGAQ